MPVLDKLSINPFTQDMDELVRDLNDRIEQDNDYFRDCETPGLPVYVGANGFTTALDNKGATVTTSTTLDNTYDVVLVDATAAAVTITLPAAASNTGRQYYIKKIDAVNPVTIDANASETIDGQTDWVMHLIRSALHLYCDGTNWWIIGIVNGAS